MTGLNFLTNDEVESIHRTTLRILEDIGIGLENEAAREILTGAGARIYNGRVHLPPDLVEKMLAQCPHQVSVQGREGRAMTLGDGNLYWHNVGGASHVYDHGSGTRRAATVQDVQDSTRLLDALDGVTTITPFFTPQDVPGPVMSLAMYRHALPYTTKPVQGPGVQVAAEVRFAVEMASVIGSPHEVLSLSTSPISPLSFPGAMAECVIEIARANVPFAPLPCPTAGATAPLSLAGALAQQSAENLACIVLAQLVQPGLPIVYCGRLAVMEPRTGGSVWGGVELGLISAVTVQIGHFYHLPVNVYGFSTNSHILDVQNGYERALNAAIPALAGADELSGVGEMSAGIQGSLAQMVCDNEIAASIRRLRRGIQVTEDTLALEVIGQVMGGSRNFLDQMHTVRHLRAGELFVTKLAERRSWEDWERHDRQLMADRAQAEAERILAEHQVPQLTEEQQRHLQEIMQEAESELVSS